MPIAPPRPLFFLSRQGPSGAATLSAAEAERVDIETLNCLVGGLSRPVVLIEAVETVAGVQARHACSASARIGYQRRPRPGFFLSSNRTRKELPDQVLPSRPAIAARASWPSISMKPKPRHLPVKTSLASLIERTVPYSANNSVTLSSDAFSGKFQTNIFFKR
jgi:hypothetical protein